jgi:hypothetical protein
VKKFREKETRAVKAVRVGVAEVTTVNAVAGTVVGAQLGPKLVLGEEQDALIATALNHGGTDQPNPTTPTVQFGRAAHLANDVAKKDE